MNAENALLGDRLDDAHLAPELKVLRHPEEHGHLDAGFIGELLEGAQRAGAVQQPHQKRAGIRGQVLHHDLVETRWHAMKLAWLAEQRANKAFGERQAHGARLTAGSSRGRSARYGLSTGGGGIAPAAPARRCCCCGGGGAHTATSARMPTLSVMVLRKLVET